MPPRLPHLPYDVTVTQLLLARGSRWFTFYADRVYRALRLAGTHALRTFYGTRRAFRMPYAATPRARADVQQTMNMSSGWVRTRRRINLQLGSKSAVWYAAPLPHIYQPPARKRHLIARRNTHLALLWFSYLHAPWRAVWTLSRLNALLHGVALWKINYVRARRSALLTYHLPLPHRDWFRYVCYYLPPALSVDFAGSGSPVLAPVRTLRYTAYALQVLLRVTYRYSSATCPSRHLDIHHLTPFPPPPHFT